MNIIYYIVPFFITLTILVFVHEIGHFLVARLLKIKVKIFSIGVGREIIGYNDKNGTRWRLSLLPIGGYVMMAGDSDIASVTTDEVSSLSSRSPMEKIFVSFAGPFSNFCYAILVFAMIFVFYGQKILLPVVSNVMKDSPASIAGLQIGDKIVSINGKDVNTFEDIFSIVQSDKSLHMTVERKNHDVFFYDVIPSEERINGRVVRRIGISADQFVYKKENILNAFKLGIKECYFAFCEIASQTIKMFTNSNGLAELGGPICIAKVSGTIAKQGCFYQYLLFTALLSINLGFVNLLPLPVLDGGGIILNVVEMVTGRSLSQRVRNLLMLAGFSVVIVVMILTTFNDFLRECIGRGIFS